MKKLAVFFLSMSLFLSACGGAEPEKAESFVCGTGARQCFAMSGDTLISAAGNGVRGFDLMGGTVFDIRADMAHPAVCSNGSGAASSRSSSSPRPLTRTRAEPSTCSTQSANRSA